ncbi:MAG: hypothetical protein ABW277_24735 [Longimicrobiaceae bacterium]|jgi:ABC-type glycerol-3-phosphate transport system substrate-binding protein
MLNNRLSIFAVAGLVALAACGGGDDVSEGGETVSSDTAAVAGMDTVSVPTVVPTTDSVVTTTTVETDTVHGSTDTVAADTTTRP